MLRRKTHADLDQLLVQIGPRIQVFGLVISGQRGQHARPGVDLGIQPCDLVPGVHDHRLVGIGQVFRHGTVGLRSSQAVGPFHLHRQGLSHENLADGSVLPGQKVLMQRPLRLSGALQLHIGPVRDDGHGVLHHAGKVPRHVLLFQSFGLGRGLSDHPRQTVPLHKLGIKTQSAALEGHGPEATGQQAQTVGIVVGGMVLDKDELPRWQRHRLCGDTTVDPHEGRAVFVIKAEPAGRPGHNVHKVPPVVTGPPDQFQRDETEEGRIQDAGNDGAQVGPLQVPYKTAVQLLGFRGGRAAVRRSRPKREVRAVEHAVFSG